MTTTFHHAGSAIIVEKQGANTTAAYTYGNSLVRKDGEVPLYDGLGSARAQTNSQQSVTATLTPDAFGQTVATSGSTASPYGYAGDWGYRTEGDAGLMHVGARYYDAQVARFVSRDIYLDLAHSVARAAASPTTPQRGKHSTFGSACWTGLPRTSYR